jgi:hypothetical protein
MLEEETVMSLMDQALKANVQFAKKYDPKLGGHPQPKIAIVTCMDPRLSDLEGIEPLRVCRRLFRLSHAAMAGSSSMA